ALKHRKCVYLAWTPVLSIEFDGFGRLVKRMWATPEDTMPLWMRTSGMEQICGDEGDDDGQ
ncbi:MAG: hypothetical protein WCK05_08755, partial [Planctomycetota bacterium]